MNRSFSRPLFFIMKFQRNVLLKKYTTFKIGGPAKYFFIAKTKEDFIWAVKSAKKMKLPIFILSGGSNLIVSDKGYKGAVIKLSNTNLKFNGSKIYVSAGVSLNWLVYFALNKELSGLEWAAGIPGQVGGAVFGNAGAFGKSLKETIVEVEAINLKSSKIKKFSQKECNFGYRTSFFKNNSGWVVLSCELKLKPGSKKKIKSKMQEYIDYRYSRHPKQPSAGSVFKNINIKTLNPDFFQRFPDAKKFVKEGILPVAYLIYQCGLKGEKINQAQISELHPNFIINLGGARAEDVLGLIKLVKKKIKAKFDVVLEEEVRFLK